MGKTMLAFPLLLKEVSNSDESYPLNQTTLRNNEKLDDKNYFSVV